MTTSAPGCGPGMARSDWPLAQRLIVPGAEELWAAFRVVALIRAHREALEERAGIIAEGCGMGQAQALKEARWQVDRERAWRAFLRNARCILNAAEGARAGLLARYQAEAESRYGDATGTSMAGAMRGWIKAADQGGSGQAHG